MSVNEVIDSLVEEREDITNIFITKIYRGGCSFSVQAEPTQDLGLLIDIMETNLEVLKQEYDNSMEVTYDSEARATYIRVNKGLVGHSRIQNKNIILDYHKNGSIVGIEILNSGRPKVEDI